MSRPKVDPIARAGFTAARTIALIDARGQRAEACEYARNPMNSIHGRFASDRIARCTAEWQEIERILRLEFAP